jgi:hypothetical protein
VTVTVTRAVPLPSSGVHGVVVVEQIQQSSPMAYTSVGSPGSRTLGVGSQARRKRHARARSSSLPVVGNAKAGFPSPAAAPSVPATHAANKHTRMPQMGQCTQRATWRVLWGGEAPKGPLLLDDGGHVEVDARFPNLAAGEAAQHTCRRGQQAQKLRRGAIRWTTHIACVCGVMGSREAAAAGAVWRWR